MGIKQSNLSETDIKKYIETTFLNRHEILKLHRLFETLQKCRTHLTGEISKDRVSSTTLRTMPQLRHNPLSVLILRAFKRQETFSVCKEVLNESGFYETRTIEEDSMSLSETMDMFSVFSPAAPFHVKCLYAFRIYDVDQDGVIGYQDMFDITVLLTMGSLSKPDINLAIDEIFKECNKDNRELRYADFERIVETSTIFSQLFTINI